MDRHKVTKPKDIRRRHTNAFKQALVERQPVPGATVAAIAQDAGINANLPFNWRRLHLHAAALGADANSCGLVLLPATVSEPVTPSALPALAASPSAQAARTPGTVVR